MVAPPAVLSLVFHVESGEVKAYAKQQRCSLHVLHSYNHTCYVGRLNEV